MGLSGSAVFVERSYGMLNVLAIVSAYKKQGGKFSTTKLSRKSLLSRTIRQLRESAGFYGGNPTYVAVVVMTDLPEVAKEATGAGAFVVLGKAVSSAKKEVEAVVKAVSKVRTPEVRKQLRNRSYKYAPDVILDVSWSYPLLSASQYCGMVNRLLTTGASFVESGYRLAHPMLRGEDGKLFESIEQTFERATAATAAWYSATTGVKHGDKTEVFSMEPWRLERVTEKTGNVRMVNSLLPFAGLA